MRRYIHLVLAAELVLAAPFALASSEVITGTGAVTARAAIDVSITVPRVMQMRLLGHPAVIEVTAADVAAGKIIVSGPSIDLQVNDRFGYAVRAEIVHTAFATVRVAGLPSPIIATAQPAIANMPSMVGRPKAQPFAVQYELQLSGDAVPGQYAWPVALSLQQI